MKSIHQTSNGSLGNFLMFRSDVNSLPWVVLWTSWTSKVGAFCSHIHIFSPMFNGDRVLVLQDENSVDLLHDDVNILNTDELYV